jgi:hypothetical protein
MVYVLTPAAVPDCKAVIVVSLYQSIVNPASAVALIVAVSGVHLVAPTTVATVAGNAFTVATTAVRVAAAQFELFDSAKYVVVAAILGVVYVLLPVDNDVPPVAALYQLIVSSVPALADKFTVPVPHLTPFVTVAADGCAFTTPITIVRVADAHVVAVVTDPT